MVHKAVEAAAKSKLQSTVQRVEVDCVKPRSTHLAEPGVWTRPPARPGVPGAGDLAANDWCSGNSEFFERDTLALCLPRERSPARGAAETADLLSVLCTHHSAARCRKSRHLDSKNCAESAVPNQTRLTHIFKTFAL